MALYEDTFNRPNTTEAQGLGTVSSGNAIWKMIVGGARVLDGRALLATIPSIQVIETFTGNLDMVADLMSVPGNALYFRVTDKDNWLRAEINRNAVALGYTEHLWFAEYGSATRTTSSSQQFVYDATHARTWRSDGNGWRWDNANAAYQGQWENFGINRGLWFFNDSTIRSNLAGRTVTRIRLRLTRVNGGGSSSSQLAHIRPHGYSNQPSGRPDFNTGLRQEGFSWGQTRTVDLSLDWAVGFQQGYVRGVGIFVNSSNPYMIFEPNARIIIDTVQEQSNTHSHSDRAEAWSSFSLNPHPSSYTHSHSVLGSSWSHTHNRSSTGRTGQERFITTGTAYDYYVRLQKSTGGNVQTLREWLAGRDNTGETRTNRIRVRADEGSVQVFSTAVSTTEPRMSVIETDHQSARNHGIGNHGNGGTVDNFSLFTMNLPPFAPSLTFPRGNESINRQEATTFRFRHNDPDSPLMTRFDLRVRPVGGSTQTFTQFTHQEEFTFAENFFAAGDYEWSVRTYDEENLNGPYSVWEPFGAYNAPPTPVIVSPTQNQTIERSEHTARITTSGHSRYQFQRVADNGGGMDSSTIYHDQTVDSSANQFQVQFPVTDRAEWLRVRIFQNGLWSSWASVRVQVQYIRPRAPIITVQPQEERATLEVRVSHSSPQFPEPNVTRTEVHRLDDGEWMKLADSSGDTGVVQVDVAPAARKRYLYRITTHGDNGTTLVNEVLSEPMVYRGAWLYAVVDHANTVHNFRFNENGGAFTQQNDVISHRVAGRSLPVAEFGTSRIESVTAPLQLDDQHGDVEALQRIIDARSIVCYRDGRGRRVFGIIAGGTEMDARFWGETTSLTIEAVDYGRDF